MLLLCFALFDSLSKLCLCLLNKPLRKRTMGSAIWGQNNEINPNAVGLGGGWKTLKWINGGEINSV